MAVVHPHRDTHGQNTLRELDHLPRIVIQAQNIGCRVKVLQREIIGVFCSYGRQHRYFLLGRTRPELPPFRRNSKPNLPSRPETAEPL
jgi:hypothetical protein